MANDGLVHYRNLGVTIFTDAKILCLCGVITSVRMGKMWYSFVKSTGPIRKDVSKVTPWVGGRRGAI